ncbi:phosphatase PAP2 family protein [bacterium]|nr:MAG: phosphatase PAP2 family protein [bacterium]
MPGPDLALFRAINGWSESLAPLMRYLSTAHDGLPFRVLMLAIVMAMIWRGGAFRRAAVLALVAFPIADFLCNTAKKLFPMHRPFQELADVAVRVGKSGSMGTASSHAGNLAAVATVMTLNLGWRWGAPWIVLALLVGLSRVYVGVHYPSQVVFGWTIGAVVGFVAHFVTKRFARPKAEEPSDASAAAT